jgi:aminoglycoside/choline kinase family phosphotransferase
MDDLGDVHLQQLASRQPHHRVEATYRAVIDTLFDLTRKARTGFDPDWTCQSRAYDRTLILEKECRYFVDAFLNGFLNRGVDYRDLAPEFETLAQSVIDHGTAGLIHRDLQSRNIMLHRGRHYFIDFQGARPGPVQYDLASLLIDPYARLDQGLQDRLLAYAADRAARRLSVSVDTFVRGYRFAAVTRNLQMLGAFAFLTREKGKTGFERWIRPALAMLVGHLQAAGHPPRLTAIAQTVKLG